MTTEQLLVDEKVYNDSRLLLLKIKRNEGMISFLDIYKMIDLYLLSGGKKHYKTNRDNHTDILYVYNGLLEYVRGYSH